jgi:hypothetical protein
MVGKSVSAHGRIATPAGRWMPATAAATDDERSALSIG